MAASIDPKVRTLGGQVFGLATRGSDGKVQSQAQGIIEYLTVYHWPHDNVPSETKLAVLATLTAHGRSDDESPSKWACWTLSFAVLCFPEFQKAISATGAREYRFQPLPDDVLLSCTTFIEAAQNTADEATDQKYLTARANLVLPSGFPAMNTSATSYPPDLGACTTLPAVYGYCSLLILLAAKKVNDKNRAAITEKRPDNLINAHPVGAGRFVLREDAGRIGDYGHGMVNQAWSTYTKARAAIVTETAAFASGVSQAQRIVYTVTKMMEYSGMQPAFYINKFLLAIPWAGRITCIRPALEAYAQSLREVVAAPAHLQPYYKVIHGEATRAFHRNAILPLSACAIAYERHLSSAMANFDLGPGAANCVAMFDAEATKIGMPTIGELTFREAEAEEVE